MSKKEGISGKDLTKLLNSQDRCCYLTGVELTPDTASLDHMIPVSRGGKHQIDNLCILHQDVNRAKGAMTDAEFIDMCRLVVAQHGAEFVSKRKWPQ